MSTTLSTLRVKHQSIYYKSFRSHCTSEALVLTYHFHLTPDIDFYPTITIPLPRHTPTPPLSELSGIIFSLGLIELLSYWKSACPAKIIIECGTLSAAQEAFFKKLLIKGMGEFYFINEIDFSAPDFVTILSSGPTYPLARTPQAQGSCVLLAGGKDSSLVLELLKETTPQPWGLTVGSTPSALRSMELAHYPMDHAITITRKIDPALLALNKQGYLNGHTPFSAIIAHLSYLIGTLYGIKYFIVGNERSASEGNTLFHGLEVNHQYSKSYEFETDMRRYGASTLHPDIEYLSLLRPLYEIQIAKLFSRYPSHFSNFKSCNVHQKLDAWCLTCPKCLFVYLMMRPWITEAQALEIFKGNPLNQPHAEELINALTGRSPVKPLECVGTREESILGAHLTYEKLQSEGLPLPKALTCVVQATTPRRELLKEMGNEHHLPATLYTLLMETLAR